MQLFYDPEAGPNLTGFLLNPEESRHAIKVLRHTIGDDLHITNGEGQLFKGRIEDVQKKQALINTGEVIKTEKPQPEINLAISPLKKPDRNDFLIEKAVELGVQKIFFFRSSQTVKQNIKQERTEKIAASAMKQSFRLLLPKIYQPRHFIHVLEDLTSRELLIASQPHQDSKPIWKYEGKNDSVTLLIGPEGDFTKEEMETAINAGAKPVWLGEARYRSETAALVGIHSIALMSLLKNDPKY